MTEDTILEIIESINRSWLESRYDDIAPFIHEQAVLIAPGGQRIEGKEAFLQSYRDFGTAAKVHQFQPSPPVITIWEQSAAAYCPFTIQYEIESGVYNESGADIMIFSKEPGGWLVLWRTLLSSQITE